MFARVGGPFPQSSPESLLTPWAWPKVPGQQLLANEKWELANSPASSHLRWDDTETCSSLSPRGPQWDQPRCSQWWPAHLGQSVSASFTYLSHFFTCLPEFSGITPQINHLPPILVWVLLQKRGTPGLPALSFPFRGPQGPLWIPLSYNPFCASVRNLSVFRHRHPAKWKLWPFFFVRKVMGIIYFSHFFS